MNKGLLASHSAVFDEVFFGEMQRDQCYVTDFDSTTFKLFLDCLMGFEPYTVLDSLLIFPIAYKYQTEECMKKCIEILTPKDMNQTVCHALNMALFYECEELIDNIITFLKGKCNIVALLEKEEYHSVLEPITVAKLLEIKGIDFYLMKIIYKWAGDYLKKSNKLVNIGWFLNENKILDKMFEITFESVKSILDFCEFNDTTNIFTSKQISSILKRNISIDCPRKFPNESSWVLVKKEDKLTENFSFVKPICFCDIREDVPLNIQISRNEIIPMETVIGSGNPISCMISISYCYSIGVNGCLYTNQNINFSFDESSTFKKGKKSVYEIKLPLNLSFFCLNTLEVTYTFNVDCKILKTSLDPSIVDENKCLCHTYDITGQLSVEVETISMANNIDCLEIIPNSTSFIKGIPPPAKIKKYVVRFEQ